MASIMPAEMTTSDARKEKTETLPLSIISRKPISRRLVVQQDSSNGEQVVATPSRLPTVGIVMRTKDRAVLLRRALESVRDQTHADWKLVVVNDGSAPEQVDWLVDRMFAHDPRVLVIHHASSRGMEAASNAGLAQLDTDYAAIHDDDDSWAPEFLATMLTTLQHRQREFPSIRGIACRANRVHETVIGNEIIIERVEPHNSWDFDNIYNGILSIQPMILRNLFPSICFIFDLSVARNIGLFDESLPVLGDWDFNTRFLMHSDIWMCPEFLSFHHHRSSATGSLGNNVLYGAQKHRLYNQLLRNKIIRTTNNHSGTDIANLIMSMEIYETLKLEFGHLIWKSYQIDNSINALKRPHRKPLRSLTRRIESLFKRIVQA
ncbi:glycosyltransferase [Ancylobacter sp. WKF20]|uniref:glycosyltransferase family 2 protein n=1 Tax=Ancylobacter sp. WKF20 TaxID=3039801 RepID=UPI0024341962|nr:glycosyltransferase [Ancylobacter sp. WKF20]WGD30338.1 glycosyltransferase [Ancylobacter sp. WKF20]